MDATAIIILSATALGLMTGLSVGLVIGHRSDDATRHDDDPMEHPPPRVMTRIWADNVTSIKGQRRDPHL